MTVHINLADFIEPSFFNELKEQFMDRTTNLFEGQSVNDYRREENNKTEPGSMLMPPIEQHTQQLGNNLSDLREEIQSLAARLDHALSPEEPSVHGEVDGKRQQQSTLAHTLQDFSETVHAFTLMLNEIKRRVEI